MKSNNTSTYHHGNLKDELITTALEMVELDGIESVTLRELTKRLGTSRSAVYRHFDSKDALIKAVIKAGFDKLDQSIHPTLVSSNNILEKFHNMGRAYIEFALKNPKLYRMIFGNEVGKQREESCDINDEQSATGFHALVSLIVEAQENQIFKKENPLLQATVVWSMMHGLSNLLIDGHLHIQDNIDALFELTFNTLITGMKE